MILAEQPYASGRVFQVVRGNLLEEPVDAIVNAANGRLAHGGGVAGVISRAAGPALQAECDRIVRERGPLPAGSAVVSGAGKLPFKGVIHAVGPRQGEGDEEAKLGQALEAAFRCADEAEWAAVSFPAVSSGIFAVPLPVCARAYDRAVRGWFEARPETSLRQIRLCLREEEVIEAVLTELGLRP
jgi:O-acetyl-ADP-ribose deacetylase (regulator of RNase III)